MIGFFEEQKNDLIFKFSFICKLTKKNSHPHPPTKKKKKGWRVWSKRNEVRTNKDEENKRKKEEDRESFHDISLKVANERDVSVRYGAIW